jgi:hypothetical protein
MIEQIGLAIWREHWPPGQRMRLIGLGATGLVPAGEERQLGLPLDMAGGKSAVTRSKSDGRS